MELKGIELTNYLYSQTAFEIHIAMDIAIIVLCIIVAIIGIRLVVSKDE